MRPALARVIRGNLLLSAAAVLLAGCSSGADRLTSNSSNSDPIYTASVPQSIQENDAGDGVASRPLGQPTNYVYNARNYQQTYSQPVYRQPTYKQPAYQQPKPIYAPQPQVAAVQTPGMIAQGGEVQVEPGMTLFAIARANRVPVSVLAEANGIAPPYSVRTGQILKIPGNHRTAHTVLPRKSGPTVVAKAGGSHTIEPGDTLFSLGRKFGVSPYAIADLNSLPHDGTLAVGQTLRIPSGASAHVAGAEPAKAAIPEAPAIVKTAETPAPLGQSEETAAPKDQSQLAQADESPESGPAAVDPSLPGFRWPVKGKVISAYGAKPNGLRNEGINIAVPEGTSVRAADSGVVAYAGNELKGYGNLVLIRHEGGWVTAYAHNKELFVKRGDTVKRGDVIAKAGQTGSVASPQVHFEIRKGATAMDPLRFLNSSTASN
jgi:murein DD-endopeptidase MepM/ murein hydrolase activator NlpD